MTRSPLPPERRTLLNGLIDVVFTPTDADRRRRTDNALTGDGKIRAEHLTGELPVRVLPRIELGQLPAPDGTDFDTLEEYIDSLGASYAPIGAAYIVQTANGALTNEQALGALATGLLKVATVTGLLSTAVANTDYLPVASPAMTGTVTLPGNVATSGTDPTASIGLAAGTGATLDAIAGDDAFCRVTVTTGTGTAAGTLFTITWAATRPSTTYGIWVSGRNAAGHDVVAGGIGQSGATTTTCPVICRAAPAVSTQLTFNVWAIQG